MSAYAKRLESIKALVDGLEDQAEAPAFVDGAVVVKVLQNLTEKSAEDTAAIDAERARADSLQKALSAEVESRAGLQAELTAARAQLEAQRAAANAATDGLKEQLGRERELSNALTAQIGRAPPPAPPVVMPAPAAPVAYEVIVADRDVNGRQRRLLLKPLKD